jgi:hypothetical protein
LAVCYSCLAESHQPAPCDLVKRWLEREQSDDATAIWLSAKTKECPKARDLKKTREEKRRRTRGKESKGQKQKG